MSSAVLARSLLPETRATDGVQRGIDRFMPRADVTERHEILIAAPADVVMDVAMSFDMQSIPMVRFIFRARERLMGAARGPVRKPRGLVAETRALGWGVLSVRPGREYVSGAAAQPWNGNVTFQSIPAGTFAAYAEPDRVKIAWTLEAEPLGRARTRFRTETRVVATDETARRKFMRYWRWAGIGIMAIRWFMLPALRREAERRASERGVG